MVGSYAIIGDRPTSFVVYPGIGEKTVLLMGSGKYVSFATSPTILPSIIATEIDFV
jgi:hypothetical protein